MKHRASKLMVGLVCLADIFILVGGGTVWAFQQPVREQLPNFDKRQSQSEATNAEPAAKIAAAARVRGAKPDARIDYDAVTGSPKWIGSPSGFLTGPAGNGLSPAALATVPAQDPYRPTKAFIQEHQDLFGHGPSVLEAAQIKREFVTPHNGLTTVVWRQQLDDIMVFDSALISHTTRNGELVSVSSTFLPDLVAAAAAGTPGRAALQTAPAIPARRAVVLAAASLAESVNEAEVTEMSPATGAEQRRRLQAPGLDGDADAWLTWLPMSKNSLRLCWDVTLTSHTRGEMFRVLVDGQSGEVLLRRCLTDYISDASYNVFTSDSPSPFSPGHATPLGGQPPLVSRTLVTLPALNTSASPNGWIDDGNNETRGNNVDAHTDRDSNNSPDLPRPQGSPFRVFNFPLDLTQSPTTYLNASVVQLFYLCNWMHDKLYELGFTEAAGNFQNNNFGHGGLGNDALQADAQDGGGFDNANMSTPSDGSAPRMQMYLFDGPAPDRDGDFDAEIVLHEYTHGLSNRRVGGGVGISALQSAGMGEGWSDFYALALLSEPGDDVNGNYAAGGYATYLLGGLTQNYYYGIRRYPYSTDLAKNPLTFKDIDPAQAIVHTGVPRSPIIGTTADEVHNQGEVWCVTLREARARMINKYGHAVGNQLMLQLVTDGMNLSPANPNFVQARDAILQADLVDNGGANLTELWAAFARRGLGFGATSPSSSTTAGLRESFDIPDDLRITPGEGFTGKGPVGGPFTPHMMSFTLTNAGSNTFNWTMVNTSVWLNVFPAGGTLTPGGPAGAVTASLDASANSLPQGIYSTTVQFTNLTSGVGQSRAFALRVGQPDFLTESFDAGDNDLDFSTITFTPDGSSSFYSVCREVATTFPTDPTGGTTVSLSDDAFIQVTLTGTNTVAIYSRRTNVFFIGSNGYLTMSSGDSTFSESFANHFNLPRVSACFDDLDPSSGGTVSRKQTSELVAVTFSNVREFGSSATLSFQIEMFFDGRIRVSYLSVGITDGLAGLSAGLGVPAGFAESDFSSYGPCVPPLMVTVPGSATEGDGLLAGAGHVHLSAPLATNLPVALISSIPGEVSVSNTVIIAGQTNAAFDLFVHDDGLLDGSQTASITASASGHGDGSATIIVFDNETTGLQVSLPATATEGDGGVPGTVWVSSAPAATVRVSLTSSDTTEILVPASVFITAGQTSVVFIATVLDDTQIDGPQTATVTAHVQNWTDGSASITVPDNEPLTLTVNLPASAYESAGVLANAGRVSLAGTLATNLEVTLVSSDLTESIVPASVIVPAGQFFANFNLTLVDDPLVDGTQSVTVTASAAGLINGAANISVLDDESPPVPSNPNPPHLATNVPAHVTLTWQSGAETELVVNGNFETGTFAGWSKANTGSGEFVVNGGTLVPSSGDGPLPPYAGNFSVLTDQTEPGANTLYQDISIPAGVGTVMLRWADRIRNHAATFATNQSYRAEIRNTNGSVLAVAYATQPGDLLLATNWTQRSFDLSAYRGQTIRIAFMEQDGLLFFNLHLDNVSIQVPAGAPIANAVYFGTNPAPGPGQLLGSTTNTSWNLPQLTPLTTYYWRIVAQRVGTTPGPVWQFTTRGVDHFEWSAIPGPQLMGKPFATTLTARDEFGSVVSNFTGAVGLLGLAAGGVASNTILGDVIHDNSFNNGTYTIGHAFTPTNNLTVTHVRHYSGTKVSLWTDDGTLLTAQEVVSAPGTWVETPLAAPLQLSAGTRYRVGVFTDGATYYGRFDGPSTFSDGTIDQGYEAGGDSFPSATSSWRWIFVDLRYTVGSDLPIVITPTNSGNFVNGAWTGHLTVLQPATNLHLLASDTADHRGISNPFDVLVENDLAISIADAPDPVALGNNLTNVITVVNSGPAAAMGVTVTNLLPASATFVSATASQGTGVYAAGMVRCDLGTLAGGAAATLTVVSQPTTTGSITNWAFVGRVEPDGYAVNNIAAAVTSVQNPTLSITDISVAEGNSGVTNAVFQVSLIPPTRHSVLVAFATGGGTADAGNDYTATNGVLIFSPGQTNQLIRVPVFGDTNAEPDETFFVTLAGPINAILGKTVGTGTILNDDVLTLGEAVDAPGLAWVTGGSVPWNGQTFTTHDGQDAAQSGLIFDGEQSWMQTTVVGPGTLSFWWKVSSESSYDYLEFYNNNVLQSGRISGEIDWQQRTFSITAGTHILRWRYLKDFSVSSGADHGWVDQIAYLSNSPVPRITRQPANQLADTGGTATFTVVASGTAPLNYQWRFNGVAISNATTTTLTLTGVTTNQVGFYSVVVSNTFGIAISTDALLSVADAGSVFFDDFEPGVDTRQWSRFGGTVGSTILATNYGGSVSPVNSLWFNFSGSRLATTRALNTTNGGVIRFYLRLADGFDFSWEIPDLPGQGVVLEYSTNLTLNYTIIGTYDTPDFCDWTLVSTTIPTQARLPSVYFRWRQLSHSGSGFDHWALDDTLIAQELPLPVVTLQPANQRVDLGGMATFNVAASGMPPLLYQWRRNGMNIPGATGATLMITNVQSADAGSYAARVSNLTGSTTSSNALLQVNHPPVAFSHAVSVAEDMPVSFTLLAADPEGDPLTYAFVTLPAHGTLSGTAPNVTYQASPNYNGPDSFAFRVSDGAFSSALATVNITVLPVNDPPVAVARAFPLVIISPNDTNAVIVSPNNSNAVVFLDGSQSFDVDHDPLTYWWFEVGTLNLLGSGVVISNVLPVGEHMIELVVSDGAATGTNQIVVTIISAADAVARLIVLVESLDLDPRHRRPLLATLSASQAAFARGSFGAALNMLKAFQNKVRAQIAPVQPGAAVALLRGAQVIIDAMLAPAGVAETDSGAPRGRIKAVTRHANGHVRVKFEGVTWHANLIQTSTNLVDWETVGVGTEVADGVFEFEDANAGNFSTRFYRTLLPVAAGENDTQGDDD